MIYTTFGISDVVYLSKARKISSLILIKPEASYILFVSLWHSSCPQLLLSRNCIRSINYFL